LLKSQSELDKIINKPVLLKSDLQLISGIDRFLERAFTLITTLKKPKQRASALIV
jgi:hypothetical protein